VDEPTKWAPRFDAAFGLLPSDEQRKTASRKGVHYHFTPVARDAFVFCVHADNPVTNLTVAQIRDIYSGRTTSWRAVGAALDAKLLPFQRNKNSGSQTMLERIMGDDPIMPPMEEDRLGGMGDIFRDVADYRNRRGALGFSFRYYANEMVADGRIRLLAVDGVAPTVENIRNGSYPLVATAYMVTARSRSANVRRVVDFMLSPEGQKLVEETGYVPVRPASEP
jgi:phosphate transport system substrate-binding protein